MTTPADRSRRAFIASMSLLSAVPMSAAAWRTDLARQAPPRPARLRGLAARADDFLLAPGVVYLQTGSLGPTPRPVMDRAIAAWKELEQNPVYYAYGPQEQAMEETRAKVAAFVGCGTDELLITRSTTEGMNWVAQGLGLKAGDRVLTTDQEHPGGRVCWDYVARKHGVALDVVPVRHGEHEARAIVDRFESAITPRTRVLSFSHLLTSTGLRMPVAGLCALARERGCLSVVDGAQAVGAIEVDVKALGCDVYAASGHKWLMAPAGTGLLYLSAAIGNTVDPIPLQAGRAVYSASSGVTNIPGVLAMATAVDYLNAIGVGAIERYNLALRQRVFAAIQGVPRVRIVSPPKGPAASPMLSYALPDAVKSEDLYERLSRRHNVVVKVVPSQWFNGHRISTHLFNTPEDVDRLVGALKTELT
jgi:selenocysteine lyase/cysteine desulfurase